MPKKEITKEDNTNITQTLHTAPVILKVIKNYLVYCLDHESVMMDNHH